MKILPLESIGTLHLRTHKHKSSLTGKYWICSILELCKAFDNAMYWVTQKLPQICTVILRILIGKVAWFAVYICGNFWVTQYFLNWVTTSWADSTPPYTCLRTNWEQEKRGGFLILSSWESKSKVLRCMSLGSPLCHTTCRVKTTLMYSSICFYRSSEKIGGF